MRTIHDFILDRIDEDQSLAEHMIKRQGVRYLRMPALTGSADLNPWNPWNVLALCAARRRTVASHQVSDLDEDRLPGPCDELRELAAEWAAHPDYLVVWAPRHRVPSQAGGPFPRQLARPTA